MVRISDWRKNTELKEYIVPRTYESHNQKSSSNGSKEENRETRP